MKIAILLPALMLFCLYAAVSAPFDTEIGSVDDKVGVLVGEGFKRTIFAIDEQIGELADYKDSKTKVLESFINMFKTGSLYVGLPVDHKTAASMDKYLREQVALVGNFNDYRIGSWTYDNGMWRAKVKLQSAEKFTVGDVVINEDRGTGRWSLVVFSADLAHMTRFEVQN